MIINVTNAEGAHGSLAEKFKEYMYSKKLDLIASPEYFESVLHRIESGTILSFPFFF